MCVYVCVCVHVCVCVPMTPDHNNWCNKTGLCGLGRHAVYSIRGFDRLQVDGSS